MSKTIQLKNKKTGMLEAIEPLEITKSAWGFSILVGSELEAFKSAYEYRNSKHGVKVEYAGGRGCWMVTVFNELAKNAGIDGAR